MAKIRVTFKCYDAMVKRGEGDATRWVCIGSLNTLGACREAGVTKCKPRFMRG